MAVALVSEELLHNGNNEGVKLVSLQFFQVCHGI